LLLLVLTLIGVSVIIFFGLRLVPGDVTTSILEEGAASPQEAERLKERLGLNRPIYVQYAEWLSKALVLDFGQSYRGHRDIRPAILKAIPVSANLAVYAIAITFLASLPIGVLAALRQDTLLDYVLRVTAIIGISIPNFWLGIMILYFLASAFQWRQTRLVSCVLQRSPLEKCCTWTLLVR
jgi:peptide/nickel transport system permease protein